MKQRRKEGKKRKYDIKSENSKRRKIYLISKLFEMMA